MIYKEREVQNLQNRVLELERQLAEARTLIRALSAPGQDEDQVNIAQQRIEELNAIIQTLHDPVLVYDENGVISMANASAIRAHGFDPTGHHRRDTNQTLMVRDPNGKKVHSEDLPSARALRGETVIDEALTITNFSRQELDILVTASPLIVNGIQKGAVSIWRDVTEARKAEKELAESRQRIRDILGSLGDGLFALNRDWSIIYINEQAARIAGSSVEEIVGKNLWELWPALRGTPLESFYRQAMETGLPGQLRAQGSQSGRWYDVSVYPSSEGITVFYLDKTEQIRMEEALRESEERFAKAFHASPSALVISRQEDGRIETVNDTFVNLFGYGKEEVIGKTSIEMGMFVNPADRQEAIQRLQKDKSVRDFELDVRLKSGEVRSISLSTETMNIGAQNMMLTMIQDISLRKQTEAALRASEERYRAVVENALDAILVTDPSQGGKVLSVNPAACRMFGYSEAEFLGLDREAMLDASDPRLAAFLEQRHHHGQITGQLTYKRKNGEQFPGEISSVFYRDKNGEQRAVAIIRDITGRKQAEEALRRSEERFAKAFHASPSAITISRLSDGLIFEVNEGWQTVLGHRPEEVLRRTTLELDIYVHPADRAEAIKRLRQGGSLRDFEIEVRHRSGEVRLVSMSAEQIEINGVECLLTIMQDITDRKQFEVALRKRESILTQAGEIAHLGAWDIEFQNQSDINANPLTWSDEVYRIFGYAPGEVQPSNELFFERVHPDDRELVRESVAQAIARRQPYVIEHRVRRADGEERIVQEHAEVFFDESGNPLRMVGAVQDITERKRAEEALRESEQRFRSLADSMPQLVWTALPDGTVDYYNSRAQEYWGIRQVMATVWEWAPVLHPEDLEATVDAWRHALETGEIYQVEHRVRMVDGSYRWHLSRGIPVHDERGRTTRWFGTATDIHDTKMAEEQGKIYAARLEHSNRELEQFAFMASHDLQEPLRKIEMFGDLLLDEVEGLNDQGRNYLKRMQNAAERMRAMVEGLLKLSRVTTQGQPFVRVNLSQVCSEVLSDLGEQIRRTNCKLDISTMPVLEGDPLQLRQLIQNLIGNALKYHLPEKPPEVKVYAKQLSGKVQIFVEDKGIGFAQQDAPRIFQPFERLVGRSQYEGSGMGLAICRRIVERHGGEITARSQPGAGTTLIVTLPVSQSENTRTDLRKDASNADSGITSGR